MVQFPEQVAVASSEICGYFVSAVANGSESTIISSRWGLVQGINELCLSALKFKPTEENLE